MNSETRIKIGRVIGQYYGDITEKLDKHLLIKHSHIWRNYLMLYPHKQNGLTIYVIRVPGATRGHIGIDENNIIKEFKIETSTNDCYDETVSYVCDYYLGYKLVIESDRKE